MYAHKGRTMKAASGKPGSLEETAEAVSMISSLHNRCVICFFFHRFVVVVVSVFLYV